MSFFQVADKFGVNQANLMKKLGYGDTSAGGTDEVRLFKENGSYVLKVWNGTEWKLCGEENLNILKKLGYGEISEPGTDEVRLFKENNIYILKSWDGAVWQAIGSLEELLHNGVVKIKTLDEGGRIYGNLYVEGKVESKSFVRITATEDNRYGLLTFQNKAGERGAYIGYGDGDAEMPLVLDKASRLALSGGDLVVADNIKATGAYGFIHDNYNPGKKYRMEMGKTWTGMGGGPVWTSSAINFSSAFTSIPRIFSQDSVKDTVNSTPKNITTTGFNLFFVKWNTEDNHVDWLAIGEK